jgi:hypothetical protein
MSRIVPLRGICFGGAPQPGSCTGSFSNDDTRHRPRTAAIPMRGIGRVRATAVTVSVGRPQYERYIAAGGARSGTWEHSESSGRGRSPS